MDVLLLDCDDNKQQDLLLKCIWLVCVYTWFRSTRRDLELEVGGQGSGVVCEVTTIEDIHR